MDNQYLNFDPYELQVPQQNRTRRTSGDVTPDPSQALAGLELGGNRRLSPVPPRDARRAPPKQTLTRKEANEKGKDMRRSCAECRRLKAKCDRVFPCSNCRRRGCAIVCPDGDLSCMQGKRLVLASTEQLHDRIAQLESALFQSHSQLRVGPHPLLAPEFLDGGFATAAGPAPPPLGESAAAAGSSVSPPASDSRGRRSPTSMGPANVTEEVIAHPDREWVSDRSVPSQYLPQPPMLQGSGHALAAKLSKLLSVLPPREECRRQSDRFFVESAWYNYMLQRDEYDRIYEPAVFAPTSSNPLSPHKLACVLMVLTLDSFLDLTREQEDPKVAMYWDATQECFDTRFGWAASLAGVQALGLMTYFVGFGWKGARASNFYWLRRMTTATQQLGMHKDPHPSLPKYEANLRRRVFHESYVIDTLICINHGHRNAINIENIECRYPDESPRVTVRYDYMRTVNNTILDYGLRPDRIAATPEEVRVIEEKVDQFHFEMLPQWHCPALSGAPIPDPPTTLLMKRDLTPQEVLITAITANSMAMNKSILFLHRPALRRVILRLRRNPESEFTDDDGEAATRTFEACRRIRICAKYFARTQPLLASRTWSTWTQIFGAAVSMAAVGIWCSPHLDPSYLSQIYYELNEIRIMIDESGSDRARGIHDLLPLLQQTVAQRYPHLVGQSEVVINLESEDMVFALIGGAVDQLGPTPTDETMLPQLQTQVGHQMQMSSSYGDSQQGQMQGIQSGPEQMVHSSNHSASSLTSSLSAGDLATVANQPYQSPQTVMQRASMAQPDPQQQYEYDMGQFMVMSQLQPRAAPAIKSPSPPHQMHQAQMQSMGMHPMRPNMSPPQGPHMPPTVSTGPFPNQGVEPGDIALSPSELWNRLQTFYEPAVWWSPTDGTDPAAQQDASNQNVTYEVQHVYPPGAMGMY